MIELLDDGSALERVGPGEVTALTERATKSTFYVEGLTSEQVADNRRVVAISADHALAASRNPHQRLTACFVDETFAGYMIATIHAADDRELDWMMVDPAFQGSGVADALIRAGIEWLGADRPMWLNVIRHNERAIRFYGRHGFEVDWQARIERVVPHLVMRRRPAPVPVWLPPVPSRR